MTATEAHYAFKLAMDRVDSATNQHFFPQEIDFFLNEAQLLFVHEFYTASSNPKNEGFEQTQKRFDDLSTLVVSQGPLTPTALGNSMYELKLSSLTEPYLHFVSAKAVVSAKNCLTTYPLRLVQHDDLFEAIKDPFVSRDAVLFNFAKDNGSSSSIIMYSPSTITEVYITYIKYPSRFSLGSYTYIDGITYPQNTFELPTHTHQQIVDRAVRAASLATQNPEHIQTSSLKTSIGD